jgi:hypothetical protein
LESSPEGFEALRRKETSAAGDALDAAETPIKGTAKDSPKMSTSPAGVVRMFPKAEEKTAVRDPSKLFGARFSLGTG